MAYIKMQDILDEFSRHNKKVFSINDVARIIGKPKTYASKLLSHSRKVGRDRFFGYKKVGNLYIATVEKAIIDSLYMGSPPLSYVEEAFSAASRMGLVSKDVLMNTASRMRSKVTEKKVLELIGTSGIGDAPG